MTHPTSGSVGKAALSTVPSALGARGVSAGYSLRVDGERLLQPGAESPPGRAAAA